MESWEDYIFGCFGELHFYSVLPWPAVITPLLLYEQRQSSRPGEADSWPAVVAGGWGNN